MIDMNISVILTDEFNKFGKCYQVPFNVMIVLRAKSILLTVLISVKLTGVYASKQPQNVTKEITRLN